MKSCPPDVQRLRLSLPASDRVTSGDNIEERARAVLSLIVDRLPPASELASLPADPMTCPNCSTKVESPRSPYCSEECRETGGFVRQFRAGMQDGTLLDEARQVALGQVLWHLLGGGRPLRQSLVPERSIQAVLKREAGCCQECGGDAITVDHPRSGCNRTINLRGGL